MKILIDSITHIPAGVALKLTPEQFQARQHALEKFGTKPDIFVGTQALVFKAGEIIEIAGELQAGILPIYDKIKAVDEVTSAQSVQTDVPLHKPAKHRKSKQDEPTILNTDG